MLAPLPPSLPILMIASLVGFGAVVAALPAFADVRDALLAVGGGPLISLTIAVNVLAGLTGTASGGMAIVLNILGDTFLGSPLSTASIPR